MKDDIQADWNLAIHALYGDTRRLLHRSHNIFLNTGREYVTQRISAGAPTSYVAYIGWGIGGSRQTDADADIAPLSVDYPGSNTQVDTDVTVTTIERPVLVTAGVWLATCAAPAFTGPTASDPAKVVYVANFSTTDLNAVGGYAKVPLSEIGLYLSSASTGSANGGGAGHMVAYKTFAPIPKSGFTIQVSWELRV